MIMFTIKKHLFLLTLILSVIQAQDSEWNGDPNICTPDSTSSTSNKPLPNFPNQAEFILETISSALTNDDISYPTISVIQHFYDYDANILALQKNRLGFFELEYYYYDQLKKTTYFPQKHCVVTDIPVNINNDGGSAFQLPDGTFHIRPLSELLQFTNRHNQQPIVPKYIGVGVFRDIAVDQWELCIVDQETKRTERQLWYFVQPEFQTSIASVTNISIPLGYAMNASIVPNDGSKNLEFNEIVNIFSFKPDLKQTFDHFVPPRGIYCPNLVTNLVSLPDLGIEWPLRYTVQIDARTSRGVRGNPLRLIVDNQIETKRARFDYMIDENNNYETIIIDYREQIKYVIDQNHGSCKIVQGVDWPDVNPESKPIEFFLKIKETMLDQPPKNAWQSRGTRLCRGSTVRCTMNTMIINDYPPIIDSQTGTYKGQNWNETHIEYAWSTRYLNKTVESNKSNTYDYPVSLFFRTHQITETASDTKYLSEDIEYEFYEMSNSIPNDGFDVSVCYRSRDWPYLHLAFTLKSKRGNLVDGNHLDRKALHDRFLIALQIAMKPISIMRLHQLEIDHDVTAPSDTIYVMFLLLGYIPKPDFISVNGTSTTVKPSVRISIEAAREQLRNSINNGDFNVDIQLLDDDRSNITFKAIPNSLQNARDFLESHPLIINLENKTISEINVVNMTNTIVNILVIYEEKFEWKWSSKAQTTGIIVGLLIGLVVGVITILLIRSIRKNSISNRSSMVQMTSLSNVNYDKKQETIVTNSNVSDA